MEGRGIPVDKQDAEGRVNDFVSKAMRRIGGQNCVGRDLGHGSRTTRFMEEINQ